MESYQLSTEYYGHEQDVKALDYTSEGEILSVSRDGVLRKFGGGEAYLGIKKFLNSVVYLPKDENSDTDYYIVGGSDKNISIYHPRQFDEPIMIMKGHLDNVCCLDKLDDGRIVSGSWDKTIKVWKDFSLQFTLKGHQHAVWSVKSMKNGQWIVSGSADKTIKIWNSLDGSLIHTLNAHQDCVRGIDEIKDKGFVSCGNDGIIKVWDYNFNLIHELHGHSSFVYTVQCIDPDTMQFVSGAEDRSVKIWKENQCTQTIAIPAISIWTVKCLPNKNIVTGSSDGIVRVFTKDPNQVADEETLKKYQDKVALQALPSNQVGDINKEKLEGSEALLIPGKKEGEVKMVKNQDKVEAHQWDQINQQWVKIGEVVDAIGNNRKQVYQGKEYDYVFDINLADGAPNLKLPYNVTDNPFNSAMDFIQKHQLPVEYLDQIVQFINQNAAPVSLGQHTSNNPDPYTRSEKKNKVERKIINDPIAFKQINLGQVVNKIELFNKELENKELCISDDDMQVFKQYILKEEFNEKVINALLKIITSWPKQNKFPGVDLMRYSLFKTNYYQQNNIIQYVYPIISNNEQLSKQDDINNMLSFRMINNLLVLKDNNLDLEELISKLDKVANSVINGSDLTKIAYVSIFVNLSHKDLNDEIKSQLILILGNLLNCLLPSEAIYRALVVLFNFKVKDNELTNQLLQVIEFDKIIIKVKNQNVESKVLKLIDDITNF